MKQCTEASHLSLSSWREVRRKNRRAHWPEKERSLFMAYHSKHRHIHKHTCWTISVEYHLQLYKIFTVDCTCSLYCMHAHTYIFQIFVSSPGFPPVGVRGQWWKTCDVSYAARMPVSAVGERCATQCKHIFVRLTVMTVYIGHNFCWESLSSSQKNYAGVIRLEFAHSK